MTTSATSTRSIQVSDLLRYRLLEDHAIQPGGERIAFVASQASGERHRYATAIWLTGVNGGEPERLTDGDSASQPRWRPDGGAIAYVGDAGNGARIQIREMSTGQTTEITAIAGGVAGFAWAPDGQSLVVAASNVAPGPAPEVKRITRVHYKNDGLGLLPEHRSRLWLVQLSDPASARQLTSVDEDDVNAVFSPDGASIAFNRTRPSENGSAPFMDVYALDLASGAELNLTRGAGPCFGPSWSPDGSTIAYIGHTEPADIWWGKSFEVWTVPAAGGDRRHVTSGFAEICARAVFGDPWRGIPLPKAVWSDDGAHLFFTATVGGNVHLFTCPSGGGEVRQLTSGRSVVTDFDLAGEVIVYGRMASDAPADLWRTSVSGGEPTQITALNAALLAEARPSASELISFASFDGQTIEAWLLPPADFDPAGMTKHPLVLSIHGGPHAAYGEAYHHSFQSFSGVGAFVLYVNPRGSQGYGEDFAKSVIGDWGGGDYRDIMAAIDHVAARGRVDTTKMMAWGTSYGGFMTTWMAGQTDRFAAICSLLPVTDLLSMYGTSDIGHYFVPYEMGARPWEDEERYRRMSPITYAANVTTPIMLIHHEQDLRCPIGQSEQYFVMLKTMGKEVEFVRIEDASHGIVPPARAHSELYGLELAHEWFARHTG